MKQSEITELPSLSPYRYENFFNVYMDNGQYFYNLLRSINIFSPQDHNIEDIHVVLPQETWILISYNYYKTIELWWLVCAYNQIQNPLSLPEPGTKIRLLKSEYLALVLQELNNQINR